MTQEDINWKQTITVIILTGLVTLASSLVLDWYKSEEPKLIYSVTSSDPFEGKESYLSVYHIVVENQGKNQLSDVNTVIESFDSQIVESKIKIDPSLNYNESISNNSYKLRLDYMNPTDIIQLSLLISSQVPPKDPKISVRGKGANGIMQTFPSQNSTSSQNSASNDLLGPLTVGIALMGTLTTIRSYKGKGEQHENLVYLCGVNGLNEDAEYYSKNKTNYMAASDYLTFKALNGDSQEYKDKVIKLFTDLISYTNVLDSSKGVIYYNIARIEMSRDNPKAVTSASIPN